MRWLRRRFGTWRGLVRLLLAELALSRGKLDAFLPASLPAPRRLVFVCQGNICRSAFAVQAAQGLGLPVASLGLATCSGAAAPAAARAAAARLGVDLHAHRALDWTDFDVQPGDLFLAMEVRQAEELQRRLAGYEAVAVSLLGLWCEPPRPHVHDPFTLSADYFDTCFGHLAQAVRALRRIAQPWPHGPHGPHEWQALQQAQPESQHAGPAPATVTCEARQ